MPNEPIQNQDKFSWPEEHFIEPENGTFETLTNKENEQAIAKALEKVRARKRIKPRYKLIKKNEIGTIHAMFLSQSQLLDANDHMHSEGNTKEPNRSYAQKNMMKTIRNTCLAISAFTLIGAGIITAQYNYYETQKIQEQIEKQENTNVPKAVTATATDIASISHTRIEKDGKNRPHVTTKITSKSTGTWNVHVTMDVVVAGTNNRGEPWEGTLKNIPIDSATENVIYDGKQLIIGALQPESTRELDLYPRFDDNNLNGITIDTIKHVELICQDALTTATDPSFIDTSHLTTRTSLTPDGKGVSIYVEVDSNRKFNTDEACLYAVFTNRHLNIVGTRSEENVTFPFGISTAITHRQNFPQEQKCTISEVFDTSDTDAANTRVLGIVIPQK